MAYTTGTATDHVDLLDRLETFISSNGWTTLHDGVNNLVAKGTGDNGFDEVFVSVETTENAGSSIYNWKLTGAMTYLGQGDTLEAEPFALHEQYLQLWDQAIPYWFFVNGRRLIVVAKVDTKYAIAHMGLLRPFATDEQFPYPYMLGGTYHTDVSYTSTLPLGFWAGDTQRASIYTAAGVPHWMESFSNSSRPIFLPRIGDTTDGGVVYDLSTTIDGSYTILPIIVILKKVQPTIASTLGQVDGFYWVSGYGQASENIITVGSDNYIVFPEMNATGNQNWCAVLLA